MYQLVRPSRQHVVLVHGEGVGPWVWAPFAGALPAGAQIHRPTLPGHGRTPEEFTSPARAAEVVAAQVGLDDLPGEVVVIGTSVGGQVAIELARAHPHAVSRVVAIGAPVEPHPAGPLVAALSGLTTSRAGTSRRTTARSARLQASLVDRQVCADTCRGLSAATSEALVRSRLGHRCGPVPEEVATLLVSGTLDSRRLRSGHARLAASAPHVRTVQVDGRSAAAPAARPRELAAAVTRWAQIGQTA